MPPMYSCIAIGLTSGLRFTHHIASTAISLWSALLHHHPESGQTGSTSLSLSFSLIIHLFILCSQSVSNTLTGPLAAVLLSAHVHTPPPLEQRWSQQPSISVWLSVHSTESGAGEHFPALVYYSATAHLQPLCP